MAAVRRRKMIGRKRRVEDEEGGPDQLDLDDDSLTEGSIGTDDGDNDADSDTSNLDDASPVGPNARKPKSTGNGAPRHPAPAASHLPLIADSRPAADTQAMMQGLATKGEAENETGTNFDDAASTADSKPVPKGPLVVSSSSANRQPIEPQGDRRRREHEEYKRRRDEDPAFVPNRGAFFMHDHRHAGPAANGFRPFGRGRGRGGRGGGSIGGPFAPYNQYQGPSDPLTSGQWAHDMHEAVAEPPPARPSRHIPDDEGLPNGNGFIPQCPPNATPINRTMSTEKQLGKVQVKVYLPIIGKGPVTSGSMSVKQYTKLPDHRPPLRRDKPVRISLPDNPPKYIYPAVDRSFIFIPRAMRPNQQRGPRGKPRSGLGSIGGFSRRTSVFGGGPGSFYGSAYSPSIALSRRSSLAPDGREYLFSPTGSVVSRPPMPIDNPRPVVRLPPSAQLPMQPPVGMMMPLEQPIQPPMPQPMPQDELSINDFPAPQNHPLPQRPIQENRAQPIMHQPRPQKTVSVADIESPSLNQQPFDQAFHQQVPVQVSNGLGQEGHARRPSYSTQHSAGTPVSQIPERAIHAAPFQPNPYQQQQQQPQGYYGQAWGMMQPQQGYYYSPQYSGSNMGPAASGGPFVPSSQQSQGQGYNPQTQGEQNPGPQYGQQGGAGMVAQEVNGMVYYYDPSQVQQMNTYSGYQQPSQGYGGSGVPGMAGMVTPSPDGLYYPQQGPGMMFYPQ